MLDIYPTATYEDSVKPKKWHSKVSITSDYFSTYSKSNDDGVSHFCNDKPLSGFPQLQPKPKTNPLSFSRSSLIITESANTNGSQTNFLYLLQNIFLGCKKSKHVKRGHWWFVSRF